MSEEFVERLREYHEEFYSKFIDYMNEVEHGFMDQDDLTPEDLHRGKHFLAHGIAEQFRAKQELLFESSQVLSNPLLDSIRQLHERCLHSIRQLHDSVNQLTHADASEEDRVQQPRTILRHLHQIDALLGITFEIEENCFGKVNLEEKKQAQLFERLDEGLKENTGCASQGKHQMN